MIPIEEAKRLMLEAATVLGTEEVSLEEAAGRVLAERVGADREFPPTDRSAMDGFAVRSRDLGEDGGTLRVVGELRAGQPLGDLEVGEGEAVRIMTGAIVPPGADAVVMVEYTEENGDAGTVLFRQGPGGRDHIRRRGEDLARGETVLEPGGPIHAADISALAAVGKVRLRVHRLPRVAVLTTGDEIIPPSAIPADHQLRNSNSATLLALLAECGVRGRDLGTVSDHVEELDRVLADGLSGDLLLITGGVSMGKYDLVGDALERAGVERLFHKVSVKPGKPLLAGRLRGCLVAGLPGNPVSAFTGFTVFVAPVLRRMMGYRRTANLEVTATATAPFRSSRDRTVYSLARVEYEDGGYRATPVRSSGSGDVLSVARANAFAICPAGKKTVPEGSPMQALLWKDSWLRRD